MARVILSAALFAGVSAFSPAAPGNAARRAGIVKGEMVEEFDIQRQIKAVRCFEGDYSAEICQEVVEIGRSAIARKGTFSLCVPGGSVVKALSGLADDAMDFTKVHVFFANEEIDGQQNHKGVMEALGAKIDEANVHAVPQGEPADVATQYAATLASHESIDQDGPCPSVDLILLGTGGDGHCGSLFPNSPEIKAKKGEVVLPIAEKNAVAVSMDFMSASKIALVSAAGKARAPMVAKALSGEFGFYDCPAGMVDAQVETLWFVDTESIAEFDTEGEWEDEGEENE